MERLNLVLGLYDDPEHQAQNNYTIDLFQNNLAIFGTSMSGKTTLLKTILIRIHQVCRVTEKEEIYILDFGSNLSAFERLPYTIAYFDAANEENVRRIFSLVESHFTSNMKALQGESYLQSENKPSHVTFIIDGLNALLSDDRYSSYIDSLRQISRDGISKGVSVIFTANESSGGVNRLLSSFKRIIALELPREHYAELFGRRAEKPISTAGRGLVNIGDGLYEFQAYLPFNTDTNDLKDEDQINGLWDLYEQYFCTPSEERSIDQSEVKRNAEILLNCHNKKIKHFTDDLTKINWGKYAGTEWGEYRPSNECRSSEFVAGLEYYNLFPIKVDLLNTRSIAIYGKKNSGKSNILSLILETALSIPNVEFFVWDDARDACKVSSVSRIINLAKKSTIVKNLNEFEHELKSQGFYDLPTTTLGDDLYFPGSDNKPTEPAFQLKPHPFTVFVIQSRLFYQSTMGGSSKQLIQRLEPFICNEDSANKKLFVFSDVQRIVDDVNRACFNNWIDHAFLLDDIVRFIGSPRGQKSVFGIMDVDEIKDSFGKCELGDGYYLNLELVELSKLKFLKQSEE